MIRTAVTVCCIWWTLTLEHNLGVKTEENGHSEERSRRLLGGTLLCIVHAKTTERCFQEKDPSLKIQSLSSREHVDFKTGGIPHTTSQWKLFLPPQKLWYFKADAAWPILLQLNSSRKNFIHLWSKQRDSHALLLLGLSPCKLLDV